jgi:hypothetical protein
VHRALVAHALAQAVSIAKASQNESSELKLGPLEEVISKELRIHLERGSAALGLSELLGHDLQIELFAIGNGVAVCWESEPENTLLMVYHCYKQPKAFTGGGIRLFDRRNEKDAKGSAALFRDIEIELTETGPDGTISKIFPATGIIFRTTPADWFFDWHATTRACSWRRWR